MPLSDKEKSKVAKDATAALGKSIAPVNVVDKQAWVEYVQLRDSPILNENKMITLSNGRSVSLGSADYRLKKIVEDLPKSEQDNVMGLRRTYQVTLNRCNAKLRRAYGTVVDRKGNFKVTNNKFALVEKEMIELFGRMFTTREVHHLVLTQFNIPCTIHAITTFRDQHQIEITAKNEEHKRTYSDIRLGYKRSRLEELTYIYATRKRIYEMTKKGEDHRLLLMTLEQIRKEIEGDSLRIDGNLSVNIEQTVNQHIHQELFVNFPLKEIIISRVAARLKINPEKLLTEIERGYYNKYINTPSDVEEVLPAYPSMQTYDFDRIKRVNAQVEQTKIQEAKQVKVIQPAEEKKLLTVKEMLLQKLKFKSDNVNASRNKLNQIIIDKANKS